MAGDAKSLQALFDKIYNDRIVKQSAKRKKLKLDKQKLRRLMKRHSQVNKKYQPLQEELNAEKSPSSDEVASKADDKKLWTSNHIYINSMPQERDEVRSVLNDKGRRGPLTEMARKSLNLTKETFNIKHHTRTEGSFKSGNEKKTNHTREYSIVGKSTGLDQQCKERNFWIDQHSIPCASQKKVPHKAERSLAEWHAKRHRPYPSLFSKFHAGPVRQSIVDES